MNPFKIGDQVRFADNEMNCETEPFLAPYVIGDYVVVTDLVGNCVRVDGGRACYNSDRFDRVFFPSTEGDYIVAVIDEGAYAPARTPRVFRSEEQAFKVAEKMSKKHDAEFAVFQRIAVLSPEGVEIDG